MNTEQIMEMSLNYVLAVECRDFALIDSTKAGLEAAIEALVQERDALFGSQELIAHVAAALSERMTLAENKCEKYQEENKVLRDRTAALETHNTMLRVCLKNVIKVADRKTDEFDAARAALGANHE
jgi:CO dehydrogenase/acetyl-CoA synthase alpha subunit